MAEATHDHSGKGEKHKHGFVILHLGDSATNAKARSAIRTADVSAEQVDVKIEPSFDQMITVLLADNADRGMDAFHLSLDRVAAQYLVLNDAGAKYFVFEHHF